MKYYLLVIILFTCFINVKAQLTPAAENAIIHSEKAATRVYMENGALQVNVSPEDLKKFKAKGWLGYSNLGARGDGKTDDMDAIVATHAVANHYSLRVKADDAATYYISGKERTAIIRTETAFGKATFILDDTAVQNRNAPVFIVGSTLQPFKLNGVTTLKKNQPSINASLPARCLVTVTNAAVKQYIRLGLNQNNGSSQTDIFVADKAGKIDMQAPIIWDFDQITDITARPIDEKVLSITAGHFITIANKDSSKYNCYRRYIAIRRSNVVVDGLEHRITGEEDHGAPYDGFLNISDCAYVTVKNMVLTGHRVYTTIGAAGKPVPMGSCKRPQNSAVLN